MGYTGYAARRSSHLQVTDRVCTTYFLYLPSVVHRSALCRNRYYAEGYQERQDRGEAQKQLSKEFVRQWLIANGFQGKEGQQIPEMTDEYIESVSERYIELYEKIAGQEFVKADISDINNRIEKNVLDYLEKHLK